MSDPAGQSYQSVRDEIDAIRKELAAEREEYFLDHPEEKEIYEASLDMDIPTLRREIALLSEEWEADCRRRGWADR